MKTGRSCTKCLSSNGFTLVEAILSVAIFAMVTTACFGVFFYGQHLGHTAGKKNQAMYLAKEGMEALRAMRDHNTTLPDDGDYGLDTENPTWQLSEEPDVLEDGFTRTITIETVDEYTKKIIVSVAWQQVIEQESRFTLVGYLTPWTGAITRP